MERQLSNPALSAFLAEAGERIVVAQVLITAVSDGYELRHVEDAERPADQLKLEAVENLRAIAQFTSSGAFRPLKSSPNLRSGWRTEARTSEDLETALRHLYPGALADWHAVRQGGTATDYREFTNRQTGMYRITQMLPDLEVGQVITACCSKPFCLKQRLWSVPGTPTDVASAKSLIPCLEPCPLFLEFARKAMRILQEEKRGVELTESDHEVLQSALEAAISDCPTEVREADFNAPSNPRRIALLQAKLRPSKKS